ncbi:hypothetical protein CTZ24_05410 [Pantoea phytobeneficialis]|uniref:Uncharacterized protein n=1 Tax=Pantoea phytobeneficialis TaxID=2052056 RepID=A0AAP9KNF7_9GAMM|nr:hypothetical protein CTZ24_05410 [Pantoea phytobeneficialis]
MLMTIRCSRCGCARFFYTLNGTKLTREQHHGACCAACRKPLNLRDVVLPIPRTFPAAFTNAD